MSIDVTFRIFFIILSNNKINFNNQEFRWRLYITSEALSITRQVELIGKKKFTATALDPENKTFAVYVTSFASSNNIHLLCNT